MDALLSLGGNIGDRRATMVAAVAALATLPTTQVLAQSPYYRTAPDGPVAQDWFVNLAVAIRTDLEVDALAAACRRIEADLGRDRTWEIPWGPRPIDIDIIATGTMQQMSPHGGKLDAPAFVLVPLADIAPGTVIGGSTISGLAAAVDRRGIERLDWPVTPPG